MSMAGVRKRRVGVDRVQELLLARSIPLLHETAVLLTRDGLMADWASIVDRSGTIIAATSEDIAGRGTLLAALAWGTTADSSDTVSAVQITGFEASLVVGRRASPLGADERERLAVVAGIVGVVWGHLSDGGDDRRPGPRAPVRLAAV